MSRAVNRARIVGAIALCAVASCSVLKSVFYVDAPHAEALAKAWKTMREDLSPENEYYVGRSVATNILARHEYQYRDRDAFRDGQLQGLTAYVNQVGMVLAYAALEQPRKGDRPAPVAGFHFVVLESDVANGFAAPGGYVFVTTGAVKLAKTEDELAALLAHEIAHVVRGHALGTIKKSRYANISKDLFNATVELEGAQLEELNTLLEGSLDDMFDAYFVKGYGRDTEFEADRVGLEIMARAGYDPGAFVALLGNLAKTQTTGAGGFGATHPKADDRIAKLKEAAKKVKGGKPSSARTDRFVASTAELR